VLSVAQIGNELRVLCAGNGDAASRMREALRTQGVEADVAVIEPNLEDVFVSATHGSAGARAA
ncbi:MAG TPA: ABC transporter ATP-binding protein, partial [Pseudoxanthomonas sp.]|nr:ABC transporter ATP-binding protein [Pseudoxanthomonas sp.]